MTKVIGDAMTVELLPPVRGHCRKCGWEYRNSVGTRPTKCEECGENLNYGRPRLPYTRVNVSWGQYNLMSEEKQPQYIFNGPNGLHAGFSIDPEYAFGIDGMTPVEVCQELLDITGRYVYYGRRKEIEELMVKLQEREEEDAMNAALDTVERLKEELYEAIRAVADLEE